MTENKVRIEDHEGNAYYPHNTADVTFMNDGTTVEEKINSQLDLSSSVLKIPLKNDYRGWQGVAVHNNLIYIFTDRNENFELENIISVYTLDGRFVSEKRNAYTALDPQGKFMSFGDANEIDGYLYATLYNFNGGGSPKISRIVKFNIPDLSINEVYEIGGNVAESVTKHADAFWVIYHDIFVVRKFDLNFNLIQEYQLNINSAPQGGFQGTLWEGEYFYANLHGHNTNEDNNPFVEMRKYLFDGTNFNFIETITPPTDGCGQGIGKYGNYYFWNDRPNNMIVITKTLKRGNVFSEILPYQNEFSFKPTLLNGWQIYDAVYDREPRVTVNNGFAFLSGIARVTAEVIMTDPNKPIFAIPKRYAPKYSINVLAATNKGPINIAIIGKQSQNGAEYVGRVVVQNLPNYSDILWVAFDNVSYPILE